LTFKTISNVNFASPCANCTLMGFTTFVTFDHKCFITFGFMNKCMVLEFDKSKTTLNFTLHLNKIKFGPNLATLALATKPSCSNYSLTLISLEQSLIMCFNCPQLKHLVLLNYFFNIFSSRGFLFLFGTFSHFLLLSPLKFVSQP
jgi:hypothetical protein